MDRITATPEGFYIAARAAYQGCQWVGYARVFLDLPASYEAPGCLVGLVAPADALATPEEALLAAEARARECLGAHDRGHAAAGSAQEKTP